MKNTAMLARLSVMTLISLTFGCGVSPQRISTDSDPLIVGGQPLTDSNPLSKSTVALVSTDRGQPDAFCSGTLVSKRLVITAAHCLEGFDLPNSGVFFGGATPRGKVIKVESFGANPKFDFPNYDIGWVKLAEDAPDGTAPMKVWMSANPSLDFAKPAKVTLAGYGLTGENNRSSGGIRRFVEMPVREFINNSRIGFNLIVLDFSRGRGACYGDSGGPAYLQKNGTWYLAGETNGKTPDTSSNPGRCSSDGTIYTYVGGYKSWIESSSGITLSTN